MILAGGCSCDPQPTDGGVEPEAAPDAGSCRAGERECGCLPGSSCDPGLTCEDAICVDAPAQGLRFPADAAGCEILLREQGGGPVSATFAEGTRGTFVREAPLVAVTLLADETPSVSIVGAFTIEQSRCVDASGVDVPGAVEVQ